jgi:acyl transferase domain-containing protein
MDPLGLKGSRTGVYAGISNNEYRGLILGSSDTSEPAASLFSVTGTSLNTAIGRVAFVMGLEGPALSIDTACSGVAVSVSPSDVEAGTPPGEAAFHPRGTRFLPLAGKSD